MATKRSIENVLKTIPDPELGISVWDLGLIYNITVGKQGNAEIVMTLTSAGCPLFEHIADPIKKQIKKIPGIKKVNIVLTFEPPWTVGRMTKKAKKELGFS